MKKGYFLFALSAMISVFLMFFLVSAVENSTSSPSNETVCPQVIPPIDFCKNGSITLEKDSNGCLTLFKCIYKNTTVCKDSDGGKDYYVKGDVSASRGIGFDGTIYDHNPPALFLDSCFRTVNAPVDESDKVLENYCGEGIRKYNIYTCPNGCKDGACVQLTNETSCTSPGCEGRIDTGKVDANGCKIYSCPKIPTKCEDYSYNQCPSQCSNIMPPCLPCPVSIHNETELTPVCPSCKAPYCATPGQKKVYLNQKFELKNQETAKVVDYKNMEIKSLGLIEFKRPICQGENCPQYDPQYIPPFYTSKLRLQVSMSSSGGVGTNTGFTTDVAPPSLATTSTTSTGSSGSGSGGSSGTSTVGVGIGGVGTVFDLALGEKKEVFGASISLLKLEKDIAVLVVEEQIIIKPVCGNNICEAGEGEICEETLVTCEAGKECKTPPARCKVACPQDCGNVREPIYIELNDKFKLQISQAAILKSENIKVTFKNMIASQCKEEIISSKASSIAIKEKVAEAERTLTGSVVSDVSTEKPIPVLRCIGSGPKALLSFEIEREKGNPIKKGVLELDLREKKQIGDFTVAFLDYDYASRTGVFLIDKEKFKCPEKCKCDTEGNTISCPDKKICEENKILCPDGECRDKCEIKTTEDCKYGCNYEGSCFPMGVRSKGLYCGNDLVMNSQKNSEQICENNFECSSNVCVSGKCVSKGLMDKILDFFRRLFGAG